MMPDDAGLVWYKPEGWTHKSVDFAVINRDTIITALKACGTMSTSTPHLGFHKCQNCGMPVARMNGRAYAHLYLTRYLSFSRPGTWHYVWREVADPNALRGAEVCFKPEPIDLENRR